MDKHFVFVVLGILNTRYVLCGNTKITVLSDDDCGGSYVINSGSLQIKYHGTRLYDCSFTILTQDAEKKLCADFETLDIRSCATTIKLYGYNGENDERIAFKAYTCDSTDTTEYCPARVTRLHVTFKHPSLQNNDEVFLTISHASDKTHIYLILGFVAIAVISIAVPVIIIIRYKRRKRNDNKNLQRRYLIATIS